MTTPFFSIITPTFNRAHLLDRCITSVRQQTFQDWELLVIDDGSTDNTKQVVESFSRADGRIKYIYQTNQKVSAARNNGLENAKGKYICFLDSDDEYRHDHLEFFHRQLEQDNFPSAFLCNGLILKKGGQSFDFDPPRLNEYPDRKLNQIMSVFMPFSPCVQTICIPSGIKEQVRFDPRFYLTECYDFCARAAAAVSDVRFFSATTVILHIHDSNASVPGDEEGSHKFNLRQFQEFSLMKKDRFYRQITKTRVFRGKLFYLVMELAKYYFRKRDFVSFVRYSGMAVLHNPGYLVRFNYRKALKKLSQKKLRTSSSLEF